MFFACSRGKYTVRIWWFIGNFWNLCIQDGWNAALIAISGAFWWEKQDCEYWDGWHSSHRSHWLRWGRHRLTVPLLYGGLQEELPLCSVKTSAFSGCPVITAACFENCWGCSRCWAVTELLLWDVLQANQAFCVCDSSAPRFASQPGWAFGRPWMTACVCIPAGVSSSAFIRFLFVNLP